LSQPGGPWQVQAGGERELGAGPDVIILSEIGMEDLDRCLNLADLGRYKLEANGSSFRKGAEAQDLTSSSCRTLAWRIHLFLKLADLGRYKLEANGSSFRKGAEAQDLTCVCFVREGAKGGGAGGRAYVLTGTDKGRFTRDWGRPGMGGRR
jgi:hypothetical protein